MNARETTRLQFGHRFVSEAHRVMADSNMSIAAVAAAIGESEAYVRRILIGENGSSRALRAQLMPDIAWATQQWFCIAISPVFDAERMAAVKRGTA